MVVATLRTGRLRCLGAAPLRNQLVSMAASSIGSSRSHLQGSAAMACPNVAAASLLAQPAAARCSSSGAAAGRGEASTSAPSAASSGAAAPGLDVTSPDVVRLQKLRTNFCRRCGSPMLIGRSLGDRELRHICSSPSCGFVDYSNPKMVVGCIVEHQGKILLCRRAIEPCLGLWTLPAGYMELHESSADGAARETWEEANARVQVLAPYAHWDIPSIGQAYILFRAALTEPYSFSPGPETLETALFAPSDIPWDQLAFSSVAVTLRYFLEDMEALSAGKAAGYRMHHGVIDKRPGGGPNEPGTYAVRSHYQSVVTAGAPHTAEQAGSRQ